MAKAIQKNRRLKKRLRKTLGTLCLISSLIVAAIPAEGLRAANGDPKKVTVDVNNCKIPLVDVDETIYTTGDGRYQFAYVTPNSSSTNNRVAVILGYNGGYLEGGALTIPDSLDAYLKYSGSFGTTAGYAAVGKSGNFLYYREDVVVTDAYGNPVTEYVQAKDPLTGAPLFEEDGITPIMEYRPVTTPVYHPCYYNDYAKWQHLNVDEFYRVSGTTVSGGDTVNTYALTTTDEYQRIQGAEVWYIGNQYLNAGTGDDTGTWTIGGTITSSEQGIFSGQGNIVSLRVGTMLSGIGNYAFYGCSSLRSIALGNGLDTIGNYAFANCINMSQVDVDVASIIEIIGDHAFYNCRSLQSFTVPINVVSIGDSAFESCTGLTTLDLRGGGQQVRLEEVGYDAFVNCTALESLTFPATYVETIGIDTFEGCSSLKFISTSNNTVNFTDSTEYTFAQFKATVPAEFYFEGVDISRIHTLATDNYFAFSYLNQDLYEITVDENGKKAVYRVNSSNQLVYCSFDQGLDTVTLPPTIGPYGIIAIDSGTFQNNCYLKRITIPSSIISIADSAFKGCHNLENVIFKEPVNLTSIGAEAFKTQEVSFHAEGESVADSTLKNPPVLKFTGPISYDSVPFNYAMNGDNYINAGSQDRTYITYYSGWPQSLEVRYNPTTDKNELTDYPTFAALSSGTKYTANNYAYMTPEYEAAAREAVRKYNSGDSMTDYETQIIDAALNIDLPEGIEAIQESLFITNEATESNVEKTITAYSLNEVAAGSFKGCKNLKGVYLLGATTTIGDYAFEGCDKLEEAYIPTTVTSLGLRPFKGCGMMEFVNFQGSSNFVCDNSIIFQLDGSGNKQKVVEYLEGRVTGVVDATELAGITEIAEEAFAETNVSSVDFRSSSITNIPVKAFADTSRLFAVYLPKTARSIQAGAFENSGIQYMEIPGNVTYIDNTSFDGVNKSGLTFYCEDDSTAYIYATNNGINTTSRPVEQYFTVIFWDYDSTVLKTEEVAAGMDATPPAVPGREGYVHTGWLPDYHGVTRDLDVSAQYEPEDPDAAKFTVTFLDHDDTVLKTTLVLPGGKAEPPIDPVREGYTFIGWRPSIENIQANTIIYAQYEKVDSTQTQLTVRFIDYDDRVLYIQKVNSGESAITPQNPTREGYTFTGWRPAITNITKDMDTYAQYERANSGGTDGSPTPTPTPGVTPTPTPSGGGGGTTTTLYTLTVRNGSGSGSYAAGSQPIIIANDPAANQEFAGWTIEPSNVAIASKAVAATVVTMPQQNVTVTANYRARSSGGSGGSGTTTGSGNSSGGNSGNNNNNNNSTGTITNGGTTVVIDKNGLSNTGVVSATVNGSSDNFTIRITENSAATEEIIKALMAEYGDLTNIKYFPMDISLYDSTGTNRITDTTGLSISITLPLPDSLITYAGNNMVAGVVNERLDKLKPRFTTISGVACVTFTAEHFSPYVIYVDTSDLSAGTISDNTPQTGDGIHPKWFLSIGLACISIVLFMKRDRRTLQKVRA